MLSPFQYRITKDERLLISREGTLIMTLGGARAAELITKLGHDNHTDQEILARVTGNYKRGNERIGKRSPKN